MKKVFYNLLIISFFLFLSSSASSNEHNLPNPKNIIIFIGDGMGYNHILATNYYEHGKANAQIFEQDDWLHFAMATYNSILDIKDGDTIYAEGYSPQQAWLNENYLSKYYTDSAAGGTAISTGKKTFDGSIGIGIKGDTLKHISELAKQVGKSLAIVSSVPFSHATPASFLTNNVSRHNYEEIASYMLFRSKADVIMGAGNPNFDNNGNPAENNYKYVGGKEVWEQLKINDSRKSFETKDTTFCVKDANGDGNPDPWRLIQNREEFTELIDNPVQGRILGVPKIFSTLQSERPLRGDEKLPFSTPMNESVPTLEEMTKAAISIISQNREGFFIMVEGGAIDWASHDNYSSRMIEEHIDFNKSVRTAVEWVEENSNWEETMIIVTADHECGYLTGPTHPEIVNSPVKNNGKGNLPDMKWNFDSHTNQLVPFFAKGEGAELFELFADEYDPKRGYYIQNTEIAQLIFLLWGK